MHRIAVLALADVVAFDAMIPMQVFGHRDQKQNYSVSLCGGSEGVVPTTTGFSLPVPQGVEGLKDADTVIIAGYDPPIDPPRRVLDALRVAAGRDVRMISICTGAFALAAAGLLDGRRATTHWQDGADLATRFPSIDVDVDVLFVDDGNVLTSAGVAAGIDLCLHVVRRDLGEAAATEVARRMVLAPYRDGGQAQFIQRPIPAEGSSLKGTCAWARDRLSEPLSGADLAAHSGWTPRTFARRFVAEMGTSPLRWLTAQRLSEARHLLETTDLPIEHIAQRVGLGTAANLRLHLGRDAATTPTAYRATYRGRRIK